MRYHLIVEVAHTKRTPEALIRGKRVHADCATHTIEFAAEVWVLDDFRFVLAREVLQPILHREGSPTLLHRRVRMQCTQKHKYTVNGREALIKELDEGRP